jgi:hypothetical protein
VIAMGKKVTANTTHQLTGGGQTKNEKSAEKLFI